MGETGSSEITVVARTEDGKEAVTRFKLNITEPENADIVKSLPDISDSIKLIISGPRSDGSATAVVKDNYNPMTYGNRDGRRRGEDREVRAFWSGRSRIALIA